MRIRDLKYWPPKPGQSFHKNVNTGPPPEWARVKYILNVQGNTIVFVCEFEHDEFPYCFTARNEETTLVLKGILEANIGKSLFWIGEIEIPGN